MYRVLIVDDEDIVRIGLQTLLKWEDYGFQVAFKASNGMEALHIIEKEKPDLVISDVVMPVMNGVEMVQKMKEDGYGGEIIIISNHNSLEAVKQLIRLGVEDYLLKISYTAEEFIAILNNVKNKLDSRYHQNKQNIEICHTTMESIYFNQNLAKTEPIPMATLFYVKLLNDAPVKKKNIRNKVNIVIGESLKNQRYEAFFINDYEMIAIVNEENIKALGTTTEMRIQKMLELYAMERASVLSSHNINTVQLLRDRVEECMEASKNEFYGKVCGTLSSYKNRPVLKCIDSVECVTHMIHLMTHGKIDQVWKELNGTLESLKNQFVSPKELLRFMETIMVVVQAQANQRYHIQTDYDLIHEMKISEKYEDLQTICQQIFLDIKECSEKVEQEKTMSDGSVSEEIIGKIVKYIEKNIDKKITLVEIAQQVHLHPNYISAYFNKHMACSIPKYINNKKMEYAKVLLEKDNMSVKDVTEAIGINETSYFCKLYKEKYGCHPSQVAKDNMNNG